MAQLLSQTIRNTAIYALGNFAVRLVGLILIPFLTNTEYLSISGFGAFSILEIIIQLLMSVMGLGVYMGFSRFYWDKQYEHKQKSMFTMALGLTFLASIIITLAIFLWAAPINRLFFNESDYSWPLKLATLSAALQAILLLPHTLLKLQSRSGFFSAINIVRATATLGVTYFLVVQKHTALDGIYEAQVISMVITILLTSSIIVKNLDFSYSPLLFKNLTGYSFPLMVSSVLVLLLGALDRFVLNSVSGLENVAIYSLGFKLSNAIKLFIVTSIQLALSPILMKKMNDEDHGHFYNQVLQVFSVVLMFFILGVTLFGKELISLFTVEKAYESSYLVVVLLAFGFYFEMIKDNVVIGLNIKKKTLLSGTISFVAAAFGLILYRMLVPIWGINGAASAFVFVQFIYLALVYMAAQRVHYIKYNLCGVFIIMLIGAGLFGIAWLFRDASFGMYYTIKIVVLGLYPILIFSFKLLDKSWIDQLKMLINKKQ